MSPPTCTKTTYSPSQRSHGLPSSSSVHPLFPPLRKPKRPSLPHSSASHPRIPGTGLSRTPPPPQAHQSDHPPAPAPIKPFPASFPPLIPPFPRLHPVSSPTCAPVTGVAVGPCLAPASLSPGLSLPTTNLFPRGFPGAGGDGTPRARGPPFSPPLCLVELGMGMGMGWASDMCLGV